MTKHHAQEAHTPPGAARKARDGSTGTPDDSGPAERRWRVWRPLEGARPWFVDCPLTPTHGPGGVPDCMCTMETTWREAMEYVKEAMKRKPHPRHPQHVCSQCQGPWYRGPDFAPNLGPMPTPVAEPMRKGGWEQ